MNASPFDASAPVAASKPSITWVDVFRQVTLIVILSLGGGYILIMGFWTIMGPMEPESGVSFDE
jgi:hypothetical protein